MRTVVDAIVEHGGGAGTLTVVDTAGRATGSTWAQVHDRARRMSAVLRAAGLRPGSRMGLLGETTADLVTALQAAWLTGACVTMLPPPGRTVSRSYRDGLAAVAADAGLDLVVADGEPPPELSAACRVVPLAGLAAAASRSRPAEPTLPAPADLAVLQYTSGSTRAPRGVPVTHRHLAANITALKQGVDHDGGHPSVLLSWLPLYHDLGLVAFCTLPMSCGCPAVLLSTALFARRPASWLEAVSHYRATMTAAPNFAFGLMNRVLAAGFGGDLSSLRLMFSGSEPIDPAMMTVFAARAAGAGLDPRAIIPGYGLAESTLTVSHGRRWSGLRVDRLDGYSLETLGRARPPQPGARHRDLVRLGRPVPGTSIRVVARATGEPVGPRTVGHVEVRGPSVVGHYLGDPPPPEGSWFRTGDLGYLTGPEPDLDLRGEPGPGVAGELVICGREKDVVFAAGRNIHPQDVEAVAATAAAVRPGGVVAFGIPHERGDRLVVAVETTSADGAAVRSAVTAVVLAEIGIAPADVVVLAPRRLPKTTSGKPRRAESRRQYLDGELAPAGDRVEQEVR